MPPRNGASSTTTVRSPARAAVTAAAVPAEPPPTTTRSASSRTGSRVAGTVTVAATKLLAAGRRLRRRGGRQSLAQPVRDGRHRLQQHVEARDVRAGRAREHVAIRGERPVERLLLARHDRLVLREAGVDLLDEPFE